MKTKLPLLASLACLILFQKQSYAQESQFVSKEINYETFSDAACKTFLNSSGFFDFNARILWNYETKKLEIYDLTEKTIWFSGSYKTEINPDNIKGDENFRFEFDGKNSLKIKVIKLYIKDDGTYTYRIEADKQKIEIKGIESDLDFDGFGDQTQAMVNSSDINQDNSTMNLRNLYIYNNTIYDIYISVKTLLNWYGSWEQTGWIKVSPGSKVYVADNVEEYFLYYAYCKNNNGEFIQWDGKEEYNKVGNDGPYGFRKCPIANGKVDGSIWTQELFITQ